MVGDKIKQLRIEHKMTTEELAQKLGYKSASTISKWEAGAAEPPLQTVHKIAEIFGVDVNSLVVEDQEPSYYIDPEVAEMANEMYRRPELKVLFDASRNVSKEDLQYVSDLLSRLKKQQDGE